MASDAMDIDSPNVPAKTPDLRKRKHKNKDHSSPSKKRKHESSLPDGDKKSKKSKSKSKKTVVSEDTQISQDSPYNLTTATLYLPLSPISISATHALASLLAEHLSPLLLTYYPPLKGVVLAYSNASISSSPPTGSTSSKKDPNPQPLTLATTANEYGVLYVYLTATFLVFRPQRGQVLEGWINVQSEGFLGAVFLNLFTVGIERKRLPSDWKWIPPGDEQSAEERKKNRSSMASATASEDESEAPKFDAEKEHFNPVTLASDENPLADALNQDGADEADSAEGYFQSVSGHRVRGTIRFRVVDVDVIPGTDRDRGFLSIEGTMLSPEEEARVVEDERNGVMATPRRGLSPSPAMSGAVPESSNQADKPTEPSESAPTKSKDTEKEGKEKEKKSKSKSKSKKKDKESQE
ncbi:rna polymerase I subunit [Aspergillus sclerotialis]|uniref:DNA-directed RNA polymerase subunit n=1 Tax=Aspergillus sclerotialis TaxID=2070753 RepID=A0A3A3A8Z8_9EURO|nr:rna polymerase I subunit [Aspergillus sclerotialis]